MEILHEGSQSSDTISSSAGFFSLTYSFYFYSVRCLRHENWIIFSMFKLSFWNWSPCKDRLTFGDSQLHVAVPLSVESLGASETEFLFCSWYIIYNCISVDFWTLYWYSLFVCFHWILDLHECFVVVVSSCYALAMSQHICWHWPLKSKIIQRNSWFYSFTSQIEKWIIIHHSWSKDCQRNTGTHSLSKLRALWV